MLVLKPSASGDAIQEIGMAAIFPLGSASLDDSEKERRIRFHLEADQDLRYSIMDDWRRGRTFPVAPSFANWEKEVRTLGRRLHAPVVWRIGRTEETKRVQ